MMAGSDNSDTNSQYGFLRVDPVKFVPGTCRMSCRISTMSLRRLRDVPGTYVGHVRQKVIIVTDEFLRGDTK
jgi:hypothetical protein